VLFDLQTPRRRRVVRVVFGGLALIFAISFVFLGVGTGGGGFSFSDLFGGGGGGSSSTAFDDDISAAQKQLTVNPNDTAALARLVQLQYSAANANVDSNGVPTTDGEQHLREAADAWNRLQKASKGNVPLSPALYAFQALSLLGNIDFQKARTDTTTSDALTDVNAAVDDWKGVAQAQQAQIANQKNPNSTSYVKLATFLYLSGQAQAADQAAAQAKKGGNASTVDSQLKQFKQLGQQLQAAIKQLTKQQQKTQGAAGGGVTGGAPGGSNPLSGVGTGGL
jgi:hypothetical protein